MRPAYYNEIDPFAASWLRALIAAGHLPPGDVDERSITEVQAEDLRSYGQCHFFAGIGGWGLAARLAGWPDDRELWTGSCPCQPFSVAGKGAGQSDERHLWPEYFRLIAARRPDVVMGEQVAAAVGKSWLDGVHFDLAGIGYALGAAVVPACSVDAPHRRDRLWFVADGDCARSPLCPGKPGDTRTQLPAALRDGGRCYGHVGDAAEIGRDGHDGRRDGGEPAHANAWHGAGLLIGADGKARRVKPGLRLLAHGVPGRVGRLRGYGNAIVPQVAAEVIGAYLDVRP